MMHTHRSSTLIIVAIIVLALILLTSRALLPYLLIGGAILAYLALRRPQHQHAPTTHPHDPTHQHRYADQRTDQRTDLAPAPIAPHHLDAAPPAPSDSPDPPQQEGHGCGHGGGHGGAHSGGHGGHAAGRRGGCC